MSAEKVAFGCQAIADPLAFPARLPGHIVQLTDPDRIRARFISSAVMATRSCRCSSCFQTGLKNAVIRKFMNGTYHIENEFICQLDPAWFDLIPEYVIRGASRLYFLLHRQMTMRWKELPDLSEARVY